MPHTRTPGLVSLSIKGTTYFTRCWEIVLRENRGTFRFTEHNRPIVVDGDTYLPSNSVSAEAAISEGNLRPSNTAVRGVISSSALTEKMLREGVLNGADVTEFVVDWRYPFAGKTRIMRYQIGGVKWNDSVNVFEADLVSMSERLENKVGELYGRNCRWNFGDLNCDPSETLLAAWTRGATVTEVVNEAKFNLYDYDLEDSTITGGEFSDRTFDNGTVEWLTGDNAGLKSSVKIFSVLLPAGQPQNSSIYVELNLPPPSWIQVGDTMNIIAGCNKVSGIDVDGNLVGDDAIPVNSPDYIPVYKRGDCYHKFDNLLNFGGFPFMPTNDKLYMTPYARLKKDEEEEQ